VFEIASEFLQFNSIRASVILKFNFRCILLTYHHQQNSFYAIRRNSTKFNNNIGAFIYMQLYFRSVANCCPRSADFNMLKVPMLNSTRVLGGLNTVRHTDNATLQFAM
jgi:hypothetical protein